MPGRQRSPDVGLNWAAPRSILQFLATFISKSYRQGSFILTCLAVLHFLTQMEQRKAR